MRYAAAALALLAVGCQAPEPEPEPPGPCDCEVPQGLPPYLGDEAISAAVDADVVDPMLDIDGPYCPDCVVMLQAEFLTGTLSYPGYMDVLPTRVVQPDGVDANWNWYDIPDGAWQELRDTMLAPGVEWRGSWWYPCAGDEDGYPYRLGLWLPGEEEGRFRISWIRFGVRCVYEDIRSGDLDNEWFPAMEEMWTILEAMVKVYYASVPDREPDPDGPMYYLFEDE